MQNIRCYAAFGSSSTSGAGASRPGTTGYVAILARRIAQTSGDLEIVNLGGGGASVERFIRQLPDIPARRPLLVTVLGFADFVRTPPSKFSARYETLVDRLIDMDAEVFFGALRIDPTLVAGVGRGPGGSYAPADWELLHEKNEMVGRLAATRSRMHVVEVVDQNVAHPEWNAGSHPNDRGHLYLADCFWRVIGPWLIR